MDVLDLSRLQFASTTLFHYIFVPLTLGLSLMVAVMQTQYVRTGDEKYKKMTKFWGKLFLINFAMGVVTGIVQEFQFGMNWSEYSRFVGDIFGAPLAIEALMAFFIESTFIGLWIFGWDKLPQKVHLATIWLVAIASNVSSFWILLANSFMQNPVGYELVDGRAQMTDFGALIQNPYLWHQFPHVIVSGVVTGAFFVVAISAFRLAREQAPEQRAMFTSSLKMGLVFGLFSILFVWTTGHSQAQYFAKYQPMKLAVAEGLWESENPAGMSLFQIGDEAGREAVFNVRFPWLLSILAFDTPDGMVQGMNDLNAQYQEIYGPGNYIPDAIWLTYWSFRAMVGAGMLMTLLTLFGLFKWYRGTLFTPNLYMRILPYAIILPFLAGGTGWVLAEVGRQPWIVQGLMLTENGVSPNLTVVELSISLVGYVVIYGVLLLAELYLLWKYASTGTGDVILGDLSDEGLPSDDLSLEGAY